MICQANSNIKNVVIITLKSVRHYIISLKISKHSANPVLTFKDYEVFSEKVGIFRRNLYKFGDIFGDSSETFGDGSDQPSLLESRGQEVIQGP